MRDRVVEKLSGEVTVADDEIKKYYDENIQRFTDREQVKLSRIVIRTTPTCSRRVFAEQRSNSLTLCSTRSACGNSCSPSGVKR